MSKSILPTFSSESFMVSDCMYTCLIHFEFFFYMVLENVLISLFYI